MPHIRINLLSGKLIPYSGLLLHKATKRGGKERKQESTTGILYTLLNDFGY